MVFVAIWLGCGVITAIIASSKGRNGFGWLIIGCILGIFGIILAAVLPSIQTARADEVVPLALAKCPDCAEFIQPEARVCKHCGYRFVDGAEPIDARPLAPDIDVSRWAIPDQEKFRRDYRPRSS